MTTDIFCFYLQNGLIQTSQTGGQVILPPLVFPGPSFASQYPTWMEVSLRDVRTSL
jgi:hypothetical protein